MTTLDLPTVSPPTDPDAPAPVELSVKGREALHPCPIRARQRFQERIINGDPAALAIAAACALWQQQRTPEATQ